MTTVRLALCALAMIAAAEARAAPKKGMKRAPAATAPASTPQAAPESAPAAEPGPAAARGPSRIDFDDRLVQGQSNKSGAVYLYDRKDLKVRSMIKRREHFRDEIVGSLEDT